MPPSAQRSAGSPAAHQGVGLIILLGLLAAIGPLSIDTYLPSLPTIAHKLGTTGVLVQQSVSAFFLGLAAAQLVYGPLSDRYGRLPALWVGLLLYVAASGAAASAGNIGGLIAARAVQGLGAGVAPVVGRAVIRDLWSGDRAAQAMSYVVMVMSAAPLVAPFIGGQVLHWLGWRAIFWLLLALGALCLALIVWRLPETNDAERRTTHTLGAAFRAYGAVLGDARAWGYLLCGGMVSAALFTYIASAAAVYIRGYGIDPQLFGLYFGLNVVGMTVGNYLNAKWVVRFGYQRMLGVGVVVIVAAVAALLAIALAGQMSLVAIVIGLFIATSMVGVVGANAMTALLERHGPRAGAAAALFGLAQFGLGALASAIAGTFYAGSVTSMLGVMLCAALLALLAYGFVLRGARGTVTPAGDQA